MKKKTPSTSRDIPFAAGTPHVTYASANRIVPRTVPLQQLKFDVWTT